MSGLARCDCCQKPYDVEPMFERFAVLHELKNGVVTDRATYSLCPDCQRFIKEWLKSEGGKK